MNPSYQNEIGKLLAQARSELQISLQEASNALHIRAHYLQALEAGDLDVLPGAAYTKGYLLSYASFLRLDRDEILRRFERVEDDLPERSLFFPQVFSNEKNPSHSVVWGGVGVALIAYLVWFMAFRPATSDIALVEAPPAQVEKFDGYHIPGSVFNLPCSKTTARLYPPCYGMDKLPPRRHIVSVMELAK